jgi:hypothetical protein
MRHASHTHVRRAPRPCIRTGTVYAVVHDPAPGLTASIAGPAESHLVPDESRRPSPTQGRSQPSALAPPSHAPSSPRQSRPRHALPMNHSEAAVTPTPERTALASPAPSHPIRAAGSGPDSGAVARPPQDNRAGGPRNAALHRHQRRNRHSVDSPVSLSNAPLLIWQRRCFRVWLSGKPGPARRGGGNLQSPSRRARPDDDGVRRRGQPRGRRLAISTPPNLYRQPRVIRAARLPGRLRCRRPASDR